jgi:hypothetical protein
MPLFNANDLRRVAKADFGYLSEARSADVLRKFAQKSLDDEFDIFMSHRSLDSEVIYGLKNGSRDSAFRSMSIQSFITISIEPT